MYNSALTVAEVAHLLNVHADAVRWWTKLSTLQCYHTKPTGHLALRVDGGNDSGHRFTLPLAQVGGTARG